MRASEQLVVDVTRSNMRVIHDTESNGARMSTSLRDRRFVVADGTIATAGAYATVSVCVRVGPLA